MNAAGKGRVTPGDLAARQMAVMACVGAAAERVAQYPDSGAAVAALDRATRRLAAADRAQTAEVRGFIAALMGEMGVMAGGFPPPVPRRPVMRVIHGGLAGRTP